MLTLKFYSLAICNHSILLPVKMQFKLAAATAFSACAAHKSPLVKLHYDPSGQWSDQNVTETAITTVVSCVLWRGAASLVLNTSSVK